ncbi:MAG: DUF1127 domain-containing protein [Paracoccaceae bacterium]
MAYATTTRIEAGLFDRIASAFRSFKAQNVKHRAFRKTVLELESLSTHELNDLGISRGDIQSIAYQSTFNA